MPLRDRSADRRRGVAPGMRTCRRRICGRRCSSATTSRSTPTAVVGPICGARQRLPDRRGRRVRDSILWDGVAVEAGARVDGGDPREQRPRSARARSSRAARSSATARRSPPAPCSRRTHVSRQPTGRLLVERLRDSLLAGYIDRTYRAEIMRRMRFAVPVPPQGVRREPPARRDTLFLGSYPPRECGIATFTKDVVESYRSRFGTSERNHRDRRAGRRGRVYRRRTCSRACTQDDRASYTRVAAHRSTPIRRSCSTFSTSTACSAAPTASGSSTCSRLVRSRSSFRCIRFCRNRPKAIAARGAHDLCERADASSSSRQTGQRHFDRRVRRRSRRSCTSSITASPTFRFDSTDAAKASFGLGGRTVISTFGLINRGKGLEYAIEAMRTRRQAASRSALSDSRRNASRRAAPRRRIVSRDRSQRLVAEYGLQTQRAARRQISRFRRACRIIWAPPTSI